jgi:hypothetical protein
VITKRKEKKVPKPPETLFPFLFFFTSLSRRPTHRARPSRIVWPTSLLSLLFFLSRDQPSSGPACLPAHLQSARSTFPSLPGADKWGQPVRRFPYLQPAGFSPMAAAPPPPQSPSLSSVDRSTTQISPCRESTDHIPVKTSQLWSFCKRAPTVFNITKMLSTFKEPYNQVLFLLF